MNGEILNLLLVYHFDLLVIYTSRNSIVSHVWYIFQFSFATGQVERDIFWVAAHIEYSVKRKKTTKKNNVQGTSKRKNLCLSLSLETKQCLIVN